MRLMLCAWIVLGVTGSGLGQSVPADMSTPYKAPAGDLKQEVLWASPCEQPDGAGLAFSGQSQSADDGQPHTRIKEGDAWRPIADELHKANPLQKYHEQVWSLRTRLKDATTRARFIFFEGRPAEQEKAWLEANVSPKISKLAEGLTALRRQLRERSNPEPYEAGQVKFALDHLAAAAEAITPPAGRVRAEELAALRQAQQHLEIVAEAFDAEPSPRVCSPLVYDSTTKLYVLFGGDHFDYLTNDTWVFDVARRRWFQRHPRSAPAPRGDHRMKASGDGKVTLSDGFTYTSSTGYGSNQYCHIGDGQWIYDVAADTWKGPAGSVAQQADSRTYRSGAYLPEHFMAGPRPDAAGNEERLKDLAPNAWMKMSVPQLLFLNRDWGTVTLDVDRDMLIYWSGGHCVHSGSDVPHYHLSTNRWELHAPIEMPLGFIGASGVGVGGRNFTGRPWMSNHTCNSYAYDSQMKKLVVVGRNNPKMDGYTYLYDPQIGDWTHRFKVPAGMNIGPLDVNVRSTPKGVLAWTRDRNILYLLDRATMAWSPLPFEGKLPAPMVDHCGLVYDPKRDRVLFVQKLYGEEYPFNGQIYALNMKTSKVTALSPSGMEKMGGLFRKGNLREVVYDPQSDLFLWAAWLPGDDRMLAYDPATNAWVALKVKGPAPFDVSTGLAYDPKRKLIWLALGSVTAGEIFVLRFDAAKADTQPVSELAIPAAATAKANSADS